MKIQERIKFLRNKHLRLTQEEFAKKINISRANLGSIEVCRINVTERVISDICFKFGVNEKWLRDGMGETFIKTKKTVLDVLTDEYDLDDMDRKIVELYLKLNLSQRKTVKECVRSLVETVTGPEDTDDIEKELESYRRELELEKGETARSSVSDGLREAEK